MKINKVALFLRPNLNKSLFKEIESIFNSFNIEVFVSESKSNFHKENNLKFDELCSLCDAIVSLGGDGTFISMARKCISYNKPIFGINAGNLGFLTHISKSNLNTFLQDILEDNYYTYERIILQASINKHNQSLLAYAFNDIVIDRNSDSMSVIKAFMRDKLFNIYKADGLIISTPAGSTAYNMSAGGSILHPACQNFILTPICPHSLSQRPLVLPSSYKITFRINNAVVLIDGQDKFFLNENDSISITASKDYKINIMAPKDYSYFSTLKDKLSWGDAN